MADGYQFTGKVIVMGELRTGVSQKTGKTWASQDVTLEEVDVRYPKRVCVNVFGEDRIKDLAFQVGELCTITFEINAQEFQGRWYNKLDCWKKELVALQQPMAQPAMPQQPIGQHPSPAQMATPPQQASFTDGGFTQDPGEPGLPF